MASELKVINIQLDAVRRKLARVQKAVQVNPEVPNVNLQSKHFLQLQLKTIEAAYAEYEAHQQQIYALNVDDNVRRNAETNYIAFEASYGELYVFLTKLLDDTVKKEMVPAVQPVAAAQPTLSHLPPLKVPLPTFDGSYENWYAFKSMFETIMSRYQFESPAIKLFHLRNSLVGKAAWIIDQEIINNNDYAAAWEMLTERFEDRRLIIDKHIDTLFDLPKLTKEGAGDLRKLVDTCVRNVDALKNLGLPVTGLGESMLINRIASKLDCETRKAWELNQVGEEHPTYEATLDFLRDRCRVLEKINPILKPIQKSVKLQRPTGETKVKSSSLVATANKCGHCSGDHELWRCDSFKRSSLSERYSTLRKLGACFNCLQKGHRTSECSSEHSCKRCKKRHHTTLHPDDNQPKSNEASVVTSAVKTGPPRQAESSDASSASNQEGEGTEHQSTFCVQGQTKGKQILLSTAVVLVYGRGDNLYPCRVLLDSGSHTNFVSEQFVTLLCLKREPANFSISGLNDIHTRVRFKIHTKIKSRVNDYSACLEFLVVPRITENLPFTRVDVAALGLPGDIQLADPNFSVPDRVDMLLGAEVFFEMLKSGRMRLPCSKTILQETQFGWVLSGSVPVEGATVNSFCTTLNEEDVGELVKRFWQIETYSEPEQQKESTEEDCLKHFKETHDRTAEGRYVVRLPFNDQQQQLGDSRKTAEKRFLSLEKRLDRNPEVKKQYATFLHDYEALGHMKENPTAAEDDPRTVYYLPHHYILKPTSSTTKLRVVFDGSAESDSGISINQTQMIGPTVQNDLVSILLNFRTHRYAFTADIPKMYRQVGVHKDDVRYQRIVWREERDQPLQTYDLQTVTYGLASSPFLATMALRQLAEDEGEAFPLAARAVTKSFYIDDVLTGANTLEEAIELKNQIVGLLERGCFSVHKFCSNSDELLADIPEEQIEAGMNIEDPSINIVMKTLGVAWEPRSDEFTFVVNIDPVAETDRLTKRVILSQIAKIFDPFGFLGPVVTAAKLIMRELWALELDWDQPVPQEMAELWTEFHRQLSSLNDVKISRWILSSEACAYELHGFSDASNLAYGACVYIRLMRPDGSSEMRLVCSKSRILPKQKENQKPITTPRAELLAALLLSRLVTKLLEALDLEVTSVTLWSDSQIVLCWIRKAPEVLSVYVGNRVKEIQLLTERFNWRYVPSKSNPADLISRGVQPRDLKKLSLWWSGPAMLQRVDPPVESPEPVPDEDLPELRVAAVVVPKPTNVAIFDRVSRFFLIHRALAYAVRFCDYIRSGRKQLAKGLPNADEMRRASRLMFRLAQYESFGPELQLMRVKNEIPQALRNLNPFIDQEDGLIRVGGRLEHAALAYEQRHQILLSDKHPLTATLIRYLHRTNMHIGQQGLLGIVRQQYWPLKAKNTIRNIVHRCIPCFRTKPVRANQIMGDLPDYRIQPSPLFAHTGVDFAGPFQIRSNMKLRNSATTKGYVCLFVCMATHAIHLEAVSDLTSEAFMGALLRFVSRRGMSERLYSDNGKNFEGAHNEMERLATLFHDEQHQRCLNEFCTQRGIEWSFIPPRSPHFGGIWEAGVKSMKSHLKMVLAEHKLSYEQLATVLAQIEAILNSRPLVPVSDDPNDVTAITPAHFIIGRELQSIPEPTYGGIPQGRLSRWQFIQDLKQKFWKLWTRDYLHQLQTRQKDFKIASFQEGALVLIVDENSPPLQWVLARITALHPGKDGHTRVVSLKTKGGTTTRAIKKLCVLPLETEAQNASPNPVP